MRSGFADVRIQGPSDQHRAYVAVGSSEARYHELPPADYLRGIFGRGFDLLLYRLGPFELLPDQALQQLCIPHSDAEDALPQPELVPAVGVGWGEQVAVQLPLPVDDPFEREPLYGR